jgi:DNA polymerase III subunit delta'
MFGGPNVPPLRGHFFFKKIKNTLRKGVFISHFFFLMLFGQSRARHFLTQLALSERVPHALILVGPTGSGNLAVALWFARLLQCQSPTEQGPCEQCNACRKSGQWVHPDIHFSYPTIGANAVSTDFVKEWRAALAEGPYFDANAWLQRLGADNKQGNINKEECHAIIKKLSLKAYEGRRKILLMWLPEYLGKEGNRLLKLIEEPPEDTQFLLVAENTEAILPTVLSRCQLVKTDPLDDATLEEGLRQLRQVPAERARQLAFLADGNLHTALTLADNEQNDDSALLLDWLRKCWRGHGPDLVRWTDEFAKMGRENQKQFLHYALHFLRELMSLVVTNNENIRLQGEERLTAANMAKVLNFQKINELANIFNDNVYYIERNANPKILFLDSCIRIHRILKS